MYHCTKLNSSKKLTHNFYKSEKKPLKIIKTLQDFSYVKDTVETY